MKKVLLYTMKGCPYCLEVKDILKEENINFVERDIDKYREEYGRFVKKTKNEYLPAFTLLELNKETKEVSRLKFLTPDTDFKDLTEAVNKVSEFLL